MYEKEKNMYKYFVKDEKARADIAMLLKATRKERLQFIRETIRPHINKVDYELYGTRIVREMNDDNKGRFDMTGYEDVENDNDKILNQFWYLGIYEMSCHLYLSFHKGCGTIYHLDVDDCGGFDPKYPEENCLSEDMCGYSTSEIILKILELTVLRKF